jgi:ribose-phosphate pyrophosphokinase
MPFVPYARQDEVYVDGDPLSIQVFADFINSLNFDQVVITDPHSKVTPALLHNSVVIKQHLVATDAVLFIDHHSRVPVKLVAPDLGASKKIKNLQRHLQLVGLNLDIIQCDKTRDPVTGKITGFKILDGNPRGAHCLMVDDICDGGGTFLGLGEVLDEAGATEQSLYVTHGIFSKGTEALRQRFSNIFATNSFPRRDNHIHIIELGEYA